MLAGRKPLAAFSDAAGCRPAIVERYLRMFDRHVAIGRFVRRDHKFPAVEGRAYEMHLVFFAIRGQEWRITDMIKLKEKLFSPTSVWSLDDERREGELLGYEDWMNDFHIKQFAT